MADFECSSCGHFQLVDDKHIGRKATCPKCKAQGVVASSSAPATPGPVTPPTTSSGETVYYESPDALVTNTRAVINGVTYSMSNITSVRCTYTIFANNYKGVCGFIFFGLALLLVFAGLGRMGRGELGPGAWALICRGVVVALAGVGLMWFVKWKQPIVYRLVIGSAGGEKHALECEAVERIEPIVDALNRAIVARG